MDAENHLADLRAKPDYLAVLADRLTSGNPWSGTGVETAERLILLGMGSSHFANAVAATRLRARGVTAIAVLASADPLPAVRSTDLVIAVSASGGSAETLAAAEALAPACRLVGVTNRTGTPLDAIASDVVDMHAGIEVGGVACRSFAHTLGLHLALEQSCAPGSVDAASVVGRAAEAVADLWESSATWRPMIADAVLGPHGTSLVAPGRRLSSAQQGALMLREGPRRPATASETGDWSHIDVYLTKTTDYRMLLFPGSRWESEALRWCAERGSTVVCVGSDLDQAAATVRYLHDVDDDVRLLAEVTVPELVAAHAWLTA